MDWLEFGAFVVGAGAVSLVILVAFGLAVIDAVRARDWIKGVAALAPLLLLAWGCIRSVAAGRVHWTLIVFTALVSAIVSWMLYT